MRTVQPLVISDFTLSKRAKNQQKQTKTQEKTQVTAPTICYTLLPQKPTGSMRKTAVFRSDKYSQ